MMYHYAWFLLFIVATLAFYISDLLHPPPLNLEVHMITEIIKLASTCALQVSMALVIYMLVCQSAVQQQINNRNSDRTQSTASSYLYSQSLTSTKEAFLKDSIEQMGSLGGNDSKLTESVNSTTSKRASKKLKPEDVIYQHEQNQGIRVV